MTVPGEADNPAAALANAVWGMREAIALSSTALKKAEELVLAGNSTAAAEYGCPHGPYGYKADVSP